MLDDGVNTELNHTFQTSGRHPGSELQGTSRSSPKYGVTHLPEFQETHLVNSALSKTSDLQNNEQVAVNIGPLNKTATYGTERTLPMIMNLPPD